MILLGGCQSQGSRADLESRLARQIVFTVALPKASLETGSAQTSQQEESAAQDQGQNQAVSAMPLDQLISQIIKAHHVVKVSEWNIEPLGIRAILVEIPDHETREVVSARLSSDQRVESVQFVSTYDLLSYNDPYVQLQGGIDQENIIRVHSVATGKHVAVGILDTGIDRQHPEYSSRVIYARNFVDYDLTAFDFDDHGTAVAGVIAATANNDIGIVGIAPDVKLMAFKACWQNPQNRRTSCDSYSISKALVAVLEQQPDILNLSLSGPADPLIKRLLDRASELGIILIAAVNSDNPMQTFPAGLPNVLGVASADMSGQQLPTGSVIAPGLDVLTTAPGATYAFKSGSSISTAFVTGAAALLKETQPGLTTAQFSAALSATAQLSDSAAPVLDLCLLIGKGGEANPCLPSVVIAAEKILPRSDDERTDSVTGAVSTMY